MWESIIAVGLPLIGAAYVIATRHKGTWQELGQTTRKVVLLGFGFIAAASGAAIADLLPQAPVFAILLGGAAICGAAAWLYLLMHWVTKDR